MNTGGSEPAVDAGGADEVRAPDTESPGSATDEVRAADTESPGSATDPRSSATDPRSSATNPGASATDLRSSAPEPELSVVLPVFNEGEAVMPVLRGLSEAVETAHEFIVVWDFDGDTIIVRKTEDASNGDIVVALVDEEEATLKRLRRRGDSIALEAANPAYETRIFGPDRVRVQGRLVGLIRRY